MFYDETGAVTQKAKSRDSKSSSGASAPRQSTPPPQMQSLADPPSVRAINLFTTAYAGGTYLDWLPTLYLPCGRPASLDVSFEAVALGYMANVQRRGDLRILAQEKYGIGLQHTMNALQGPKSATPETAASVLLLALFAVISSDSYHDAQNVWSKHINGILAIFESGTSSTMFQSHAGQGLLHHIISVVQIDCLQRRLPLPPQLQLLYSASWINESVQAANFWEVLGRLALLNTQFDESSISLLYIGQLQEVEKDIQSLLELMPQLFPDQFAFSDTTVSQNIDFSRTGYQPPVHSFSSFRVAQTWNTLRMTRLFNANLLHSSIMAYLSHSFAIAEDVEDTLLRILNEASNIAWQTAVEICASVPELLRPDAWVNNPSNSFLFSGWASSLIWPLSLARASPHGSEELQNYIDRQTYVLRTITGMKAMRQEPLSPDSDKNW
ncbi:hypothetical protein N7466_005066 [Penicillium verhagenii]|uniref:uncharacterized protein n=1 Tax=Penicillium verhagenii TaxID=1562060 RepID=UPI00254587AF|nr:uncharacterized protein N7466_005066 [Penicillium verhagenii]KAJ5935519.1 hypothetical protein N7466_005066 [Penicillium verhagenii]